MMKYFVKLYTVVAAITLISASSCRKQINIDLNSASPALVVQAEISDHAGGCSISLSQTVNFSSDNNFPAVIGASVIITDNAGNSTSLSETQPGLYSSNSFIGTVGNKYTMTITANGKNYQATSELLPPVNIDSIYAIDFSGFFGGGNNQTDSNLVTLVQFTDPPGVENYYRLVVVINGEVINQFFLSDDSYSDGEQITEYLSGFRGNNAPDLMPGDTVTINLESIDKASHEYFTTFNKSSGDTSPFAPTPANPTSNINNGALGYFSAYSVTSKTIVIP